MRYLLSLDNTDDLASRGTGFHGRQLARWLSWCGLAVTHSITRHQLVRSRAVRCTSQNSAVCLELSLAGGSPSELWREAGCAVAQLAAPTSEPGMCLAPLTMTSAELVAFGHRCKGEPVALAEVKAFVGGKLRLDSIGRGTGARGQIGALAAVGLRASGNDGRVIWLPKLRTMGGILRLADIRDVVGSDFQASTLAGQWVQTHDRIKLGRWIRPLLRAGKPVLLVEKADEGDDYEWELLDKDSVKASDR